MAKRKPKKPAGTEQYRKPFRMVRIPERVAAVIESLGSAESAGLTEMVRRACVEYAERRSAWPAKS